MSRNYELVTGQVSVATDKAIKFHITRGQVTSPSWIPRSLIEDGDNVKEGDTEIMVADWFCEKELHL